MKVTLWCGSELLGEADLSESRPLPPRHLVHMGTLLPTDAFARVWPALDQLNRANAAWVAEFAHLDQPMTPEGLRAHVRERGRAEELSGVSQARDAVAALALELRDESGRAISCDTISVGEWDLFATGPFDAAERAEAEAEAQRQQIVTRALC